MTSGHVELSTRLKVGSHMQNVRGLHDDLKLESIISRFKSYGCCSLILDMSGL